MSYILPMNTEADQVHRVTLEQTVYVFRYRWNSHEQAWYCYVGKSANDYAIKFKLRCGIDLLRGYKSREDTPSGRLFCIDTEAYFGRPTREETYQDGRFKLLYLGASEVI